MRTQVSIPPDSSDVLEPTNFSVKGPQLPTDKQLKRRGNCYDHRTGTFPETGPSFALCWRPVGMKRTDGALVSKVTYK